MAHIAVTYDAFAEGRFPKVCCKTGKPADFCLRQDYRYVPQWTWVLIFFGFFPFVIARAFAAQRFEGSLPMSNVAFRRIKVVQRITVAFEVLFVGLFGFAIIRANSMAAFAGTGAFIVAVVSYITGVLAEPGARPVDSRAIEVYRVHPQFVEAVRTEQPTA